MLVERIAIVATLSLLAAGCGAGPDSPTLKGYEEQCRGQDAAVCHYLAAKWLNGTGVPKDASRAREFFDLGCKAGLARSCTALAELLVNGEGGPMDKAAAAQSWSRACDAGDADSCAKLKPVTTALAAPSFKLAEEEIAAACDNGELMRCHALGAHYELAGTDTESRAKARTYYEKACAGKYPLACGALCLMLAKPSSVGTSDPSAAIGYCEQGCTAGQKSSCSTLARLSRGNKAPLPVWEPAFARACNAGVIEKCRALQTLYAPAVALPKGVVKNKEKPSEAAAKTREALTASCDAGARDACLEAGLMTLVGRGGPQDISRATALFGNACAEGTAIACAAKGIPALSGRPRNAVNAGCTKGTAADCLELARFELDRGEKGLAGARTAAQRACSLKENRGCTLLALLSFGAGTGFSDTKPVRKALEQGCDNGDGQSCRILGELLQQRLLLPKPDEQLVHNTFAKACEAGDGGGCLSAVRTLRPDRVATAAAPVDSALAAVQKVCAAGSPEGCEALGELQTATSSGDRASARAAFEKACEAGRPNACMKAAMAWKDAHDTSRAIGLARSACKSADAEGCLYAGQWAVAEALANPAVPTDFSLAKGDLQNACKERVLKACDELGSLR